MRGCGCPGPTYPVHLNHIHVPVFRLHSLWVQLWGEMVCEFCGDTASCQPCCHPNLVGPKAPHLQMVQGTGHAFPGHHAAQDWRMERFPFGVWGPSGCALKPGGLSPPVLPSPQSPCKAVL